MKESSKAMLRRMKSPEWKKAFAGRGIDVGCGDDIIDVPDVVGFDMQDGDANTLDEYFDADSFDFLHASQCLEHMRDPRTALKSWIRVVKPGGYLIITIPSWELYEGMIWPSRFNPDHKSTFSLWQKGSPAPHHCHLPSWLFENFPECHVLRCELIDDNYDYSIGTRVDQTYDFAKKVEAFIEILLVKKNEKSI